MIRTGIFLAVLALSTSSQAAIFDSIESVDVLRQEKEASITQPDSQRVPASEREPSDEPSRESKGDSKTDRQ